MTMGQELGHVCQNDVTIWVHVGAGWTPLQNRSIVLESALGHSRTLQSRQSHI